MLFASSSKSDALLPALSSSGYRIQCNIVFVRLFLFHHPSFVSPPSIIESNRLFIYSTKWTNLHFKYHGQCPERLQRRLVSPICRHAQHRNGFLLLAILAHVSIPTSFQVFAIILPPYGRKPGYGKWPAWVTHGGK